MRLTLRSQVSVCGRQCTSSSLCVRALHCLWTRYPCAAARRKKPVGVCGAPAHSSRVSAFVRVQCSTRLHTRTFVIIIIIIQALTYADTRHLCRHNCLSEYNTILYAYSVTAVAGVPTNGKRLYDTTPTRRDVLRHW